jgi:hypothetical protein
MGGEGRNSGPQYSKQIDASEQDVPQFDQGRPVNSNREAACFIAKLGGNEIHAEICEKWGQDFALSIRIIVFHY